MSEEKIVSELEIYNCLKAVIDPELYVNIVDLGLVYEIQIFKADLRVEIKMTLTSRGCPMGDAIVQDVEQTLLKNYPTLKIGVTIVWTPEWSMEMVTDDGRAELGYI